MTLRKLGALLGRKVKTPDGVGTLIGVTTPADGTWVYEDQVRCCVWYGTGRSASDSGGWIKSTYRFDEILPVTRRGRAPAPSVR